jgi:hypothetical protein
LLAQRGVYWWRRPALLAMTYLTAAGLSVLLGEWWPLAIGLLSAWSLRLMGLDPGAATKQQER